MRPRSPAAVASTARQWAVRVHRIDEAARAAPSALDPRRHDGRRLGTHPATAGSPARYCRKQTPTAILAPHCTATVVVAAVVVPPRAVVARKYRTHGNCDAGRRRRRRSCRVHTQARPTPQVVHPWGLWATTTGLSTALAAPHTQGGRTRRSPRRRSSDARQPDRRRARSTPTRTGRSETGTTTTGMTTPAQRLPLPLPHAVRPYLHVAKPTRSAHAATPRTKLRSTRSRGHHGAGLRQNKMLAMEVRVNSDPGPAAVQPVVGQHRKLAARLERHPRPSLPQLQRGW